MTHIKQLQCFTIDEQFVFVFVLFLFIFLFQSYSKTIIRLPPYLFCCTRPQSHRKYLLLTKTKMSLAIAVSDLSVPVVWLGALNILFRSSEHLGWWNSSPESMCFGVIFSLLDTLNYIFTYAAADFGLAILRSFMIYVLHSSKDQAKKHTKLSVITHSWFIPHQGHDS